jgi:hypothetical protein
LPFFKSFQLKLLTGHDVILLPQFSRQYDLTLAGNRGFHAW